MKRESGELDTKQGIPWSGKIQEEKMKRGRESGSGSGKERHEYRAELEYRNNRCVYGHGHNGLWIAEELEDKDMEFETPGAAKKRAQKRYYKHSVYGTDSYKR